MVDLDLCQQAPIPDQHHPLKPEALAQLQDLVPDGVRVGGVAGTGSDRFLGADQALSLEHPAQAPDLLFEEF